MYLAVKLCQLYTNLFTTQLVAEKKQYTNTQINNEPQYAQHIKNDSRQNKKW